MNAAKKAAFVLATAGLAAGAAAGTAAADSEAEGTVTHSPGVISGNSAQVPVHVPVNVSGNTVNGIAGLNPAFGNTASNS
ncbi:chaplin [Streptomyces sp. NPDC054863]